MADVSQQISFFIGLDFKVLPKIGGRETTNLLCVCLPFLKLAKGAKVDEWNARV